MAFLSRPLSFSIFGRVQWLSQSFLSLLRCTTADGTGLTVDAKVDEVVDETLLWIIVTGYVLPCVTTFAEYDVAIIGIIVEATDTFDGVVLFTINGWRAVCIVDNLGTIG